MPLNANDRQRYGRQLLLPEVGEAGQIRIAASRVLVVGAGGLGSPAALYLAAAGIGTLALADGDRLELSNLHRQILYRTSDCGGYKAERGSEALFALNPTIEIEPLITHLQGEALRQQVGQADVVLDCSDNLATRHAVSSACVEARKPLVSAAAVAWDGQLMFFDHRRGQGPCYHCLYPAGGAEPAHTCATHGVIGPLLGVLGAQQALMAVQVVLGFALTPSLQLFDGRSGRWQRFEITARSDCAVCGAGAAGN